MVTLTEASKLLKNQYAEDRTDKLCSTRHKQRGIWSRRSGHASSGSSERMDTCVCKGVAGRSGEP
jgi:hypothetical protein